MAKLSNAQLSVLKRLADGAVLTRYRLQWIFVGDALPVNATTVESLVKYRLITPVPGKYGARDPKPFRLTDAGRAALGLASHDDDE